MTKPKPTPARAFISSVDLEAAIARIDDDIGELLHLSHFLICDIEHGLSVDRGREDDAGITLRFQRGGIDATIWLTGQLHSKLSDLDRYLRSINEALTGSQVAA